MTAACAFLAALFFWNDPCPAPHKGQFDLAAHGLAASVSGRDWMTPAIASANSVLKASDRITLRLAEDGTEYSQNDVPVYAVGFGLERSEVALNPKGCRCILLNVSALVEAVRVLSDNPTTDLPLEIENWAAFILLHEAGHVSANLSAEASTDAASAEPDQVGPPQDEKQLEFAADLFAAQRIRDAAAPGQPGFVKAMFISIELSKASWNLLAGRLVDNFEASALNDASLMIDKGYSHPNFELRILVVNELIQQTETARQLRESFEKRREDAVADN